MGGSLQESEKEDPRGLQLLQDHAETEDDMQRPERHRQHRRRGDLLQRPLWTVEPKLDIHGGTGEEGPRLGWVVRDAIQ